MLCDIIGYVRWTVPVYRGSILFMMYSLHNAERTAAYGLGGKHAMSCRYYWRYK